MPADTTKSTKSIMSGMRQLEIRTRRMVNDSLAGEYHSVFKGRGMDFDEVREYVPGDEVRTIDWNVTARAGRPFIKKFAEERELTLLLLVDVSASGHFGAGAPSKRDIAAELACVLALSATRNNDKVGLVLFSDQIELYIPPKKGRRHVLRVVREILFYQPLRRALSQAARRHDLVAVNIRDPREQALPDVGVAVLQDAETGEVMQVDTGRRRTRERFASL